MYAYPSRECKQNVKKSEVNMVNPILMENVRGGNTMGVAHLQNQNYLVTESLNV